MLGIIVRVELYKGCAGGVPFVHSGSHPNFGTMTNERLCDKRTNANFNCNLHFKHIRPRYSLETLDCTDEIRTVSKLNLGLQNIRETFTDFEIYDIANILYST